MNKKIHISKRTVFFLLVFLVIYCSHDTLLFGTNADNRFIAIRKAFPIALTCGMLLLYPKFHISKGGLWKFLLTLLLPFVSCIVNGEEMNNYIYRAFIMAAALLMVRTEDQKFYYQSYNKILYFLSLWSIGSYLVMLVAPGILARFPSVRNTSGATYYFAVFSTVNSSLHYGVFRNSSIFREPGMLATMLTLAILNELLFEKKIRIRYMAAYSVAIVTTYSTAGYVILALLLGYYLLKENRTKYRVPLLFLIFSSILILATQTDILSMDGIIFGKFNSGSSNYGSWAARLGSIATSMLIALDNPLWGIGRYALYDVVLSSYNTFYQSVYQVVDNTNTILIGFAAYGLFYGALITWGCWRYVRKRENSILYALYLFVILAMSLSNEDMGQNIAFYYIVFDGLCGSKPAQVSGQTQQTLREMPRNEEN